MSTVRSVNGRVNVLTVEMLCGTADAGGVNRMSGKDWPNTGALLGPTPNVQLLFGLAKKLPSTTLVTIGWTGKPQLIDEVLEVRVTLPAVKVAWATSVPEFTPA